MQLRQLLKISFAMLVCMLVVLFAAVTAVPLLRALYAADETLQGQDEFPDFRADTEEEPPETAKLQIFYVMKEENTEICGIYAELYNLTANKVFYFEVPVTTKVTLSQELYRELSVHSPGLPQYMKLSKMAEHFSEEYRMDGCRRILSEALSVTAVHWVLLTEEEWLAWKEAVSVSRKTASEFFEQYTALLCDTESDEDLTRRWVYYEGYLNGSTEWKGTVPGIQKVGTFEVQKVQTKELFEEYLRKEE